MNDARHAYWQGYIRQVADTLRLRDWVIELWRDECAPESSATVICTEGQHHAVVRFFRHWEDFAPEKQREIICHELIHIPLDRIDTVVWRAKETIGGDTLVMLRTHVKDEIEWVVDWMAKAIAPTIPLPDPPMGRG